MSRWNNLCTVSVTASPETALKKLSRAQIPVYKLKKRGREVIFCVDGEYAQKVFAIFAHPCYNVTVRRKSLKKRLISFALNRAGIIVGCALFIAAAVAADGRVFKIRVTGSGSYLSAEVVRIIGESGITPPSRYTGFDKALACSRIMALRGVTFCSIEKVGASLVVDVRTDEENTSRVSYEPLKSTVCGKLISLTVVCGTAEKSVGDPVEAGEVVIGAYSVNGDGERCACLAVGFAEILSVAEICYPAPCEGEKYERQALSQCLLYGDRVEEKSVKVKPCDGGVSYEVKFSFVTVLSVNM